MRKPAAPRRARSKASEVDPRGESTLTLDGMPYRLRPSREAIAIIEDETGYALLELVRLGNTGGIPIDSLGVIAAEFIKAGAEPTDEATKHVGAKQIADLIYEAGVMKVQAALTMVLLGAATGGRTVLGEAKAATA